jgi:hypothetical protein
LFFLLVLLLLIIYFFFFLFSSSSSSSPDSNPILLAHRSEGIEELLGSMCVELMGCVWGWRMVVWSLREREGEESWKEEDMIRRLIKKGWGGEKEKKN